MFLRAPGLQAGYELGTEIHTGSEAQEAALKGTRSRLCPVRPRGRGDPERQIANGKWLVLDSRFRGNERSLYTIATIHPFLPRKGIRLDMMLG
jgi:hypothetical protein